jgi:uncharacterized protein (TIGR02271 family)
MASETIVAVFETVTEAEAVASQLRAAGIASSAIEVHKPADIRERDADTAPQQGSSGFWAWLFGEEYQSERAKYDETIARGGAVLSVVVSDAEAHDAYAVIAEHHPLDIDERTAAEPVSHSSTAGVGLTSPVTAPKTGPASLHGSVSAAGTGAVAHDVEVVPLAEEELTVGKREIAQGTARIRRFVVERPVEEQIKLRAERLLVQRRPVSGDATTTADAFTDKVVEVRETSEEPVVDKTARVFEEVVIGKQATERVETVRDTVRREDVEVVQSGAPTERASPSAIPESRNRP